MIFIGYVNPANNGSPRRIRHIFAQEQEWFTVSGKLDDDAVAALQEGIWAFRAEGNNECTPVRFLCWEGDIYSYRNLWDTLDIVFESGETEAGDFGKMLKKRIKRWSGCTQEDVFAWVKEGLVAGSITIDDLGEWINTVIPIDWKSAQAIFCSPTICDGAKVTSISFCDLKNHEDPDLVERLVVESGWLKDVREMLPEYVQLSRCENAEMQITVLLDKVAAVNEYVAPCFTDVAAQYQKTGAFWLTVTPFADKADETFLLMVDSSSQKFSALFEKHRKEIEAL